MDSLKIRFGLNALGTPQQIATLKIFEEAADTDLTPLPPKDPAESVINAMHKVVNTSLCPVETRMPSCQTLDCI